MKQSYQHECQTRDRLDTAAPDYRLERANAYLGCLRADHRTSARPSYRRREIL